MLDHIIEQAREEEIFSREDTPTEQRVLAGFMYHAGLSFAESNRSLMRVTSLFTTGIIVSDIPSSPTVTGVRRPRSMKPSSISRMKGCTCGRLWT